MCAFAHSALNNFIWRHEGFHQLCERAFPTAPASLRRGEPFGCGVGSRLRRRRYERPVARWLAPARLCRAELRRFKLPGVYRILCRTRAERRLLKYCLARSPGAMRLRPRSDGEDTDIAACGCASSWKLLVRALALTPRPQLPGLTPGVDCAGTPVGTSRRHCVCVPDRSCDRLGSPGDGHFEGCATHDTCDIAFRRDDAVAERTSKPRSTASGPVARHPSSSRSDIRHFAGRGFTGKWCSSEVAIPDAWNVAARSCSCRACAQPFVLDYLETCRRAPQVQELLAEQQRLQAEAAAFRQRHAEAAEQRDAALSASASVVEQRDAAAEDLADSRRQLDAVRERLDAMVRRQSGIAAERDAAVADAGRCRIEKDMAVAQNERLAAALDSVFDGVRYERRTARAKADSAAHQVRRCCMCD